MLHTARARAFGKLRNVQETIAAVGAADDAFAQRRPEDEPPWMAYYDAAQAGQWFAAAVRGHGPAFACSKAMSCTRLASLVMWRGDPREAASLGRKAVALGGDLTSFRAARELRQLGQFAGRHPKIQEVADFKEEIDATLRA